MASATVTKKLREEATCPICLELMTEPVSIDCGHNYCRMCIVGLIGSQTTYTSSLGTFNCPQCRRPFKSDNIRPNKQLGNIIETIKETDHGSLCKEHGEQLHLFCKDDGQFICWRCERSPQHIGHITALVEDVCQGYRKNAVGEMRHSFRSEGAARPVGASPAPPPGDRCSPCSSVTRCDQKAVIENADMSEEMQQDSVRCATQALEKYNTEMDIAAHIKKEFDRKYNPPWHCIVGRSFGSYVTYKKKHYIFFNLGELTILLFKFG